MTAWLEQVVDGLGYPGIFLLLALSRAIPPVPAEAVVPLAGLAAANGRLSFAMVVLSAGLGSAAGEFLWYLPSRRLGHERLLELLRNHGRWLTLAPEQAERATAWFERHGALAVLLCQPMPILRTLIAIPAGALGQPSWRFLALASVGSSAVVLALAAVGFVCGRQWQTAADYLGWVMLAVFALVLLAYVVRLVRQFSPRGGAGAKEA